MEFRGAPRANDTSAKDRGGNGVRINCIKRGAILYTKGDESREKPRRKVPVTTNRYKQ